MSANAATDTAVDRGVDTPSAFEPYEAYEIGDQVWTLAWVGMPFEVVGKNDETRTIMLDGTGPCSLPGGARLDLLPQNLYLLTHEVWDQIWYWPDIAGEHYDTVVDRFVEQHSSGEIVMGYAAGSLTVSTDKPERGNPFRLDLDDYAYFGQIMAQPVAAVAADGTGLVLDYDAAVPDDRWFATGPKLALKLKMVGYRWALARGTMVLNTADFD